MLRSALEREKYVVLLFMRYPLDFDKSPERHSLLEFIFEVQQKSYSNQMSNYAKEHLFSMSL